MKDLVVPAKSIRREIRLLAGCLLLALLTNVGAIIAYEGRWIELLTTWRVTLVLALGFYGLFALPRLCWVGLRRLFHRAER
jgi:hypothetical protein